MKWFLSMNNALSFYIFFLSWMIIINNPVKKAKRTPIILDIDIDGILYIVLLLN